MVRKESWAKMDFASGDIMGRSEKSIPQPEQMHSQISDRESALVVIEMHVICRKILVVPPPPEARK